MVMEMVHPLHDPVLCGPGEGDVVPGLEVRHHVTQTHSPCMGTHWHTLHQEVIERPHDGDQAPA